MAADAAPKEIAGLGGGVFNAFDSLAGITTPIIIGYLIDTTGGFGLALVFMGVSAVMAVASHLVIVRDIRRLGLEDLDLAAGPSRVEATEPTR
ncbi:hypothetical protein NE236_42760 [Actinoallomurus purpureus]|uniref:hypothetical protein n=1 Tax=Actinoallomurus purpureus TaxID=478114 RepID=UPI002093F98B|nr:hypothetical protein [Actinoallomurus purpureus]MCO6011688.1 hypothetical protein [Actinoallomurus purpureus]